jgi:biotin carboxyl carrier protein
MAHPSFRDGSFTTAFVDEHLSVLLPDEQDAAPAAEADTVVAPFAGTVVALPAPGAEVAHGAELVVLEVMKMEHAPDRDGEWEGRRRTRRGR